MTPRYTSAQLHATSVAFDCGGAFFAALILGKSGAGKSELGAELIGLGAMLVADDQTCLTRVGSEIYLTAPDPLRGLIELRGIGILNVPSIETARLAVLVDLDNVETQRMPDPKFAEVQGVCIPLLRRSNGRAFAVGLKYYILSRSGEGSLPCPS